MPTVATATGTLFMVSILLDLLAHILKSYLVFFPLLFSSFVANRTTNLQEKVEGGERKVGTEGLGKDVQFLFNTTGPMQLGKICWVHASGGGERPGRAWQRHGEWLDFGGRTRKYIASRGVWC